MVLTAVAKSHVCAKSWQPDAADPLTSFSQTGEVEDLVPLTFLLYIRWRSLPNCQDRPRLSAVVATRAKTVTSFVLSAFDIFGAEADRLFNGVALAAGRHSGGR